MNVHFFHWGISGEGCITCCTSYWMSCDSRWNIQLVPFVGFYDTSLEASSDCGFGHFSSHIWWRDWNKHPIFWSFQCSSDIQYMPLPFCWVTGIWTEGWKIGQNLLFTEFTEGRIYFLSKHRVCSQHYLISMKNTVLDGECFELWHVSHNWLPLRLKLATSTRLNGVLVIKESMVFSFQVENLWVCGRSFMVAPLRNLCLCGWLERPLNQDNTELSRVASAVNDIALRSLFTPSLSLVLVWNQLKYFLGQHYSNPGQDQDAGGCSECHGCGLMCFSQHIIRSFVQAVSDTTLTIFWEESRRLKSSDWGIHQWHLQELLSICIQVFILINREICLLTINFGHSVLSCL